MTSAMEHAQEAARLWEAEIAGDINITSTKAGGGMHNSSSTNSLSGGGGGGGTVLTWHDLRYTVYPNGKKKAHKDVLKGLTGAALPHHVLALMGPTGRALHSLPCFSSTPAQRDNSRGIWDKQLK